MRKLSVKSPGTEDRRRQIIEAALACFSEKGFVNTTMEDIRIRSGASNGSIYHHFKSKDQLAAAVYLEGIMDYQAGMIAELSKHKKAREGIYAVVRFHLCWAGEHAAWSRYLFEMRHAGFMAQTGDLIKAENKKFARAFRGYFSKHIDRGTLRKLPVEIYISLILGPCQEFVRYWLSRPVEAGLDMAAAEIAEAAWQALRAGGE